MIRYIITLALLMTMFIAFSQQEEPDNILITEANWGHEHFIFPINFAREIPLEGFEEAVFPKGWAKVDSPEFWSYAFVWDVKATTPLTTTQFEDYLQLYFDGLMDIKNLQNGNTILATNALFIENKTNEDIQNYTGKIRMYEGRYTQKMMILNAVATQQFCKKEQQSKIIFQFSPAPFEKAIWNSLSNITLKNEMCIN